MILRVALHQEKGPYGHFVACGDMVFAICEKWYWWSKHDGTMRAVRTFALNSIWKMLAGARLRLPTHNWLALAIRIMYAICLATGTHSHATILIHYGWNYNYGGKPLGSVIFLTSLTFFDPLVAVLLFLKPKLGVVLLVVLMVSDVAHDSWMVLTYGGETWKVVNLCIFLAFVLSTMSFVWRNMSLTKPRFQYAHAEV